MLRMGEWTLSLNSHAKLRDDLELEEDIERARPGSVSPLKAKADLRPYIVDSDADVDRELTRLVATLEQPKGEVWDKHHQAMRRLQLLIAGNAVECPAFYRHVLPLRKVIAANLKEIRAALVRSTPP